MHKRSSYISSALLLTIVFLASVVISAQKEQLVAGKGLNAVNVKLARYGGMQFGGGGMSSLRTTNDKGEFNFGVVPAGSYHLTVSLPKEPAGPANTDASSAKEKHEMSKSIIQNIKAREANPSVQLYDDPAKAIEWFTKSLRTSKKNGWQVVYDGLPLQG